MKITLHTPCTHNIVRHYKGNGFQQCPLRPHLYVFHQVLGTRATGTQITAVLWWAFPSPDLLFIHVFFPDKWCASLSLITEWSWTHFLVSYLTRQTLPHCPCTTPLPFLPSANKVSLCFTDEWHGANVPAHVYQRTRACTIDHTLFIQSFRFWDASGEDQTSPGIPSYHLTTTTSVSTPSGLTLISGSISWILHLTKKMVV